MKIAFPKYLNSEDLKIPVKIVKKIKPLCMQGAPLIGKKNIIESKLSRKYMCRKCRLLTSTDRTKTQKIFVRSSIGYASCLMSGPMNFPFLVRTEPGSG